MYDERRDERGIIDDFLVACPNMRSLRVSEDNAHWASAFSKQLEKLQIETDNCNGAIQNDCPLLLELSIYPGNSQLRIWIR